MVYILGIGFFLSLYYCYKNQNKIGFEALKLYNNIEQSVIYYCTNENLNIYFYDEIQNTFMVLNNPQSVKTLCSSLYFKNSTDVETFFPLMIFEKTEKFEETNTTKIYRKIVYNDTINILDKNVSEFKASIDNKESHIKNNLMAVTINIYINDEIVYKEYDITDFFSSFFLDKLDIKLNNDKNNKILWICIFNHLFSKKKTIFIDPKRYKNISIKWTFLMDDFNIISSKSPSISWFKNEYKVINQ